MRDSGGMAGMTLLLLLPLCCGGVMVRSGLQEQPAIHAAVTPVDLGLPHINWRGLTVWESAAWLGGSEGFLAQRGLEGGGMHAAVESAAEYEIRDLAVLGPGELVLLAAGPRATILRYKPDWKNFTVAYKNEDPASFLNSFDFWDDKRGVAFGDSLDGKFLILLTDDGGHSWSEAGREGIPASREGEVGFAASGTSLVAGPGGRAWLGLGGGPAGSPARVFRSQDWGITWQAVDTTVAAGRGSAGIFSLAVAGDTVVAVGGDYLAPEQVLLSPHWITVYVIVTGWTCSECE